MNAAVVLIALLFVGYPLQAAEKDQKMKNTKIKITIGNTVVTATMYDNQRLKILFRFCP